MQNLRSVSDTQLLEQTRLDAAQERSSGLAVIHQLREIALRRLDAKLGYSSLHKFCMEDLKYSSGSAWRRINAMKALQEIPELESEIVQGTLTLANVSQVQSFCEQKSKTPDEKKAILQKVSGLSKRDTEKVLAAIAPLSERPEKLRPLDEQKTELRVTLDEQTLAALDQIRDRIAHSHPGATYAETIAYLAQLGLERLNPAREPKRSFPPGENTDAVPAATRRAVWKRDDGRCGYVSPETGRVCGETRLLQVDHLVPRAKGGGHELGNLRLRCRSHNLLAAVEEFGPEKMTLYLRRGA